MCENCLRILKVEKHRQLGVFVILKKVKETGICIDKQNVKSQKQCIPENIAAVVEYSSFRTIKHFGDIIGMTPHKIQLVQEMKPIDQMRFHFAKWACDRHTEDSNFGNKKN